MSGLTAGGQVIMPLIDVRDGIISNRLFSKVSLKNLTEMLNDYNAMMSSQSDSEITAIKTQIQDIDCKVNRLLELVSEGGVKIDTIGGKQA